MRHSPSIEPSAPSEPSLNPKLQRALGCLDIRLEAELTRYRRQRFGRTVSPQQSLKLKQPAKVELMAIAGRESQVGTSAPAAIAGFPLPAAASHRSATTPPTEAASNSPLAVASQIPEGSITAAEATADTGDIFFSPQSSENAHLLATDAAPPDDYLESSEELLRSLAREEAQVRVERSFLESLATPLGVGSMLMLLLSSAMFGYVIMNPSSLGVVTSLFDRTQPTPAVSPSSNSANSNAPIPNSPPLDKQEFVDLGLDDLTTLKSRRAKGLPTAAPSPIATVSPAPKAAPQAEAQSSPETPPQITLNRETRTAPVQSAPPASDRTAAPRNEAPVRSEAPARSYTPAPTRNDSPPASSYTPLPPSLPPVAVPRVAPSAQSAPAEGGGYSYKVQVPYTGDQSLEDARRVAPDAYLRPDGNIQLGAMGSEAEAKAKAQELQTQGIPAEVHQR